jgi:hypothetical protein
MRCVQLLVQQKPNYVHSSRQLLCVHISISACICCCWLIVFSILHGFQYHVPTMITVCMIRCAGALGVCGCV